MFLFSDRIAIAHPAEKEETKTMHERRGWGGGGAGRSRAMGGNDWGHVLHVHDQRTVRKCNNNMNKKND